LAVKHWRNVICGAEITENGPKNTENGPKNTKIDPKNTENGPQNTENGPKMGKIDLRSGKNWKKDMESALGEWKSIIRAEGSAEKLEKMAVEALSVPFYYLFLDYSRKICKNKILNFWIFF
jgi:hypothetical protein